ncbi:MAG: sigma-70 family RNA polymerase sigma factor [Elusimicrobia bacterium]|nr:sigma-70 family RNA polymerase sigma factor [Elusimicrobiota bacterium]
MENVLDDKLINGTAADEDLIKAAGAGDASALGELVERYKDKVLSFMSWHFSLPREEALDMTQEVFLAVWKSAASYRRESLFSTWLFSLARNVGMTYFRHYLAKKTESVGLLFGNEEFENIPDAVPGILERLEAGERGAAVRAAVEKLPDKLKTVLLLREWEVLSYDQIASVTGIPVGTVRSRLHNAHALLLEYLSEDI